jgi:hypothetical protein
MRPSISFSRYAFHSLFSTRALRPPTSDLSDIRYTYIQYACPCSTVANTGRQAGRQAGERREVSGRRSMWMCMRMWMWMWTCAWQPCMMLASAGIDRGDVPMARTSRHHMIYGEAGMDLWTRHARAGQRGHDMQCRITSLIVCIMW